MQSKQFFTEMKGDFYNERLKIIENQSILGYTISEKVCLQGLFLAIFQQRLLFTFSKERIANSIQKFIFVSRLML